MTEVSGTNRRQILRLGLLAAGGAGLAGSGLAGCGPADKPAQAAAPTLLRVAAADATNTTGLDPRSVSAGASVIVVQHVYDSLMALEDSTFKLKLAESVEPNADATRWTIRLRSGVTFHDGRPVRAADVAYSIRTLATPPSNRASVYGEVDVANLKVVDERTVEVPLKRARADFREAVLVVFSTVFPEGTTDFSKAIGSGPYRLDASDERIVRLVANEDHWGGTPALRELEITRIADASARLAAVKDGQVDYAVGISAAGAQTERANPQVRIHRGGVANSNALSFAMNQRLAPFNDPRVRRAVRLAADRKALVENALIGLGTPGDDVVGKGLPGYAKGLAERSRDVDTPRQLFRDAGVSELTLRASDLVPGFMTAAKLLSQQLQEAGVKLTVQTVPADSFYADLKALSTVPFQTFYYSNRPAQVHLSAVTNERAVFNVTGAGPDHWKRLAAAQVTVDNDKRAAAFAELQRDFYDNGGDLLWGFQESIDVSNASVKAVPVNQTVQAFGRATFG
ncbi:ABC transporter substrate-binding protein [Virgisporangium aurantiacum]